MHRHYWNRFQNNTFNDLYFTLASCFLIIYLLYKCTYIRVNPKIGNIYKALITNIILTKYICQFVPSLYQTFCMNCFGDNMTIMNLIENAFSKNDFERVIRLCDEIPENQKAKAKQQKCLSSVKQMTL